ncbi:hypothetical protein JCM10908_001459 [Rhodotorula pacifica]|uniref:uncharacterized protein n=1 Tax=Rhodotorula pacifica TaxID=1495444 RepID=UPI00317D8F6E
MGVVCSALANMVSAIGRGIMAVFSGIAAVLNAIVSAIVSVFTTFFNCLGDILCCRCGGGRRRGGKV